MERKRPAAIDVRRGAVVDVGAEGRMPAATSQAGVGNAAAEQADRETDQWRQKLELIHGRQQKVDEEAEGDDGGSSFSSTPLLRREVRRRSERNRLASMLETVQDRIVDVAMHAPHGQHFHSALNFFEEHPDLEEMECNFLECCAVDPRPDAEFMELMDPSMKASLFKSYDAISEYFRHKQQLSSQMANPRDDVNSNLSTPIPQSGGLMSPMSWRAREKLAEAAIAGRTVGAAPGESLPASPTNAPGRSTPDGRSSCKASRPIMPSLRNSLGGRQSKAVYSEPSTPRSPLTPKGADRTVGLPRLSSASLAACQEAAAPSQANTAMPT